MRWPWMAQIGREEEPVVVAVGGAAGVRGDGDWGGGGGGVGEHPGRSAVTGEGSCNVGDGPWIHEVCKESIYREYQMFAQGGGTDGFVDVNERRLGLVDRHERLFCSAIATTTLRLPT